MKMWCEKPMQRAQKVLARSQRKLCFSADFPEVATTHPATKNHQVFDFIELNENVVCKLPATRRKK
jgi:hypothetical protein